MRLGSRIQVYDNGRPDLCLSIDSEDRRQELGGAFREVQDNNRFGAMPVSGLQADLFFVQASNGDLAVQPCFWVVPSNRNCEVFAYVSKTASVGWKRGILKRRHITGEVVV